jgi:uncharacterized protein (DUF302 family)
MERIVVFALLLGFATVALANDGLVSLRSQYSVQQTADRLASALESRGMRIFARIDHAAGAADVGQSLRPTQLVIFGNPRVGTPLMQCSQTTGIDLPQKALVWRDADGQVWLTYNDPEYLANRHVVVGCDAVLDKVKKALANFAAAAAGGG